jgi:MFS transporter, DHA2 family, multidrug resistance protein
MLDRGEELDWFGSGEIVTEAIILGILLVPRPYLHPHEPFVRPSLFRDRNFTAGVLFISIVGLTYYASLALQRLFSPSASVPIL